MLKIMTVLSCLSLIIVIISHRKTGRYKIQAAIFAWFIAVIAFSHGSRVALNYESPSVYSLILTVIIAISLFMSNGNVSDLFKGKNDD